MKLHSPYLVKAHHRVHLDETPTLLEHLSGKQAAPVLDHHREQLAKLQEVLYAGQSRAVLIVLQGMDTAGKDGTIRHIFSGINPQGCDVASFKVPTPLEARHNFLWRCQLETPACGMIKIFNRSHYEEVLSPRVHGLLTRKQARRHMDEINGWEQMLADNNTLILKFYLHISHAEQTRRLQSRIDTADKRWKLSPADFAERVFWPQYIEAYDDLLSHTSRKHAPWFIIPSDDKDVRNVTISEILVRALQGLKLRYPRASFNPKGIDLAKEDAAAAARTVARLARKARA